MGLPFPSPGKLPDPGIEPVSPALAGRFFTAAPLKKPQSIFTALKTLCVPPIYLFLLPWFYILYLYLLFIKSLSILDLGTSHGGSVVKNPPTNAGDTGMILEWGRSLEEEMATQSSILAWEIPRTEEPGGLQSMRLQKVR